MPLDVDREIEITSRIPDHRRLLVRGCGRALLLAVGVWAHCGLAIAQDRSVDNQASPGPQQVYWQVELLIEPTNMPIKKGEATLPIPSDWPEQSVAIRDESSTPGVAYRQVDLDEGLRALVVDIPATPLGEKVELSITFAVTLTPLAPPEKTQYLKIPPKPSKELSRYLNSSELIEPKNAAIKKLASELVEGKHNDWERIEAMYDWILANIELSPGAAVGSVRVLSNKKGAREDRVNLFVALCRNQKIPARMVWADRSEYAEFYLLDEAGDGRWYPCQFAGPREFGALAKPVIIEQKGDNFEVPGSKDRIRYMVEKAKVSTVRPARSKADSPSVSFMRRQIFEPQLKPK